jgi:hypothetical protein
MAALCGDRLYTSNRMSASDSEPTEYAATPAPFTTDLQQEIPMLANRYIQTVLTHDLIDAMKQDVDAMTQSERQTLSSDRQERAQQLMSRFVGIGLTVDG